MTTKKYNELINQIARGIPLKKISEDLEYSPWYVGKIKKKIDQLKYPPTLIDDEIACHRCLQRGKNWTIHHHHKSGVLVAILCHDCNVKLEQVTRMKSRRIIKLELEKDIYEDLLLKSKKEKKSLDTIIKRILRDYFEKE